MTSEIISEYDSVNDTLKSLEIEANILYSECIHEENELPPAFWLLNQKASRSHYIEFIHSLTMPKDVSECLFNMPPLKYAKYMSEQYPIYYGEEIIKLLPSSDPETIAKLIVENKLNILTGDLAVNAYLNAMKRCAK